MNSQTQFHLFHSSLPREGSPEQRNTGVQTDFTSRSLSLISSHSQYQHKADCEARPQSEDLEDFKSLARAWYLTCKADPGKELWNIMHFFLVAAVQNQRYLLFDTRCICYERSSPRGHIKQALSSDSEDSCSSFGS
jgi:hypothetical protein